MIIEAFHSEWGNHHPETIDKALEEAMYYVTGTLDDQPPRIWTRTAHPSMDDYRFFKGRTSSNYLKIKPEDFEEVLSYVLPYLGIGNSSKDLEDLKFLSRTEFERQLFGTAVGTTRSAPELGLKFKFKPNISRSLWRVIGMDYPPDWYGKVDPAFVVYNRDASANEVSLLFIRGFFTIVQEDNTAGKRYRVPIDYWKEYLEEG